MVARGTVVKAKNPAQYSATQFRRSKAGHLGILVQNIAVLGEAHARALLLDLRDGWSQMSSGPKFPIEFSEDEVTEVENDVQAADLGIEVMGTIKERLGDLWPEKGLIEHQNYEVVRTELREIKSELIVALVKNEKDGEVFLKYWPFDC